jgi:DNA gyrase subunit B
MTKKYNEDSIERYAGLAGIRKKPTPYIGPTDGDGLWTILREPADNAVDQALAGRNKSVHIIYDSAPNRYWVVDKGEGIPVGEKTFTNERGHKEKLSTFYVVTGLTHGGANFSGDTISRGTHGIGIKATNAMSKTFKVWTFRDGDWWCIEYKDTKLTKEPYKSKVPKLPHGIKCKRGTVVMFEPDLSLFRKGSSIASADIQNWCQLTAYLVPGMEVQFTNPKGKTFTLMHKRGVLDFIDKRVEELKCVAQKKIFHHDSKIADIAIAFTDAEGDNINAYTNGLLNKEGGEHVRAVMDSMFKSLQPYMKTSKSKKGEKGNKWPFTKEDLSDGLLGLVNYKISAPQFNNQPKDKLIDERVYEVAQPEFLAAWTKFWDANKSLAKQIVQRATELRSKTASFLKDKKMIKNVRAAGAGMVSKLSAVVGSAPVARRELFIVEGDSAAGTAKRARNKAFQALYPLRGKPLNVIDTKQDKVNNNAEVIGLLAALGVDLGAKVPEKTVKYGKIIALADPDVDGKHINCLIIAVLWKYAPWLIRAGMVYAVRAPLYKCRFKDNVYFGMTKDEIYRQTGTEKCEVQYIKGWGEVSESDLGIALDPARRTLYRLSAPDKKGSIRFNALMGANPGFRKRLLGVE